MTVRHALLAFALGAPTMGAAQVTRMAASPTRPLPGAVVRFTLTIPLPADSVVRVSGSLAGEPLHFIAASRTAWHAIGGIPTDGQGSIQGRAYITRVSGRIDTLRATMTLPVIPRRKAEPLAVDSNFSRPLDARTTARIERETAKARDVGRRSHDSPPMWTEAFLRPRTSRITSVFGSGRLFNGAVTSRHLGIDYAGAVGQPIMAANRGVVALVDSFFLAGNVVYIDHGAGVVTGYFHMSQHLVAVGDTVARGQEIGLVGQTGRVTGPHLHWTARYGTVTVNPGDLLTLDRDWYPPFTRPDR